MIIFCETESTSVMQVWPVLPTSNHTEIQLNIFYIFVKLFLHVICTILLAYKC